MLSYQTALFPSQGVAAFSACIILLVVAAKILQILQDPLRDVPGPLAARFSRFWELSAVRRGKFEKEHLELHQKYGNIVRLAPGKYSLTKIEDVKVIYRHGSSFTKGAFYHAFGNPDYVNADTFSERDNKRHAAKRRRIASLYSLTTLLSYEDFVDHCTRILCTRMNDLSNEGDAITVLDWMQYYAFDVIGKISVGQEFGCMENASDVGGVLKAIHDSMAYGSRVGVFPELHPWVSWLARTLKLPIPFDRILMFINTNLDIRKKGGGKDCEHDFMTKLLHLRDAGKIGEMDMINSLGANIAAGSDTTAVSLSSVVYYLAKNAEATRKLRQEIGEFFTAGKLSNPITFREAQTMPYLQAVLKEALRIHPVTGQLLVRVVPPEGLTLSDRHFPGGAEVGTSPWLVHFDKDVFGDDACVFRPERWLENEQKSVLMDSTMMAFGAGARTCLGKNISLMEMSKVVPELYRRFEFELEDPQAEWRTDGVWFVKQYFKAFIKPLTVETAGQLL